MAYTKTNWQNLPSEDTPIVSTALKNIEDGIETLDTSKVNTSDIVDNLSSTSATVPLSANQGKVLKDLINDNVPFIFSNANGTYEKHADGRLIQYGTGSCPAGVGYAEITFPISFLNANYIMIANHKYTGGGDYGGSAQLRNITNPQANTNTTAFIYSYMYDGTIANYIRNVQYVAYGRWE